MTWGTPEIVAAGDCQIYAYAGVAAEHIRGAAHHDVARVCALSGVGLGWADLINAYYDAIADLRTFDEVIVCQVKQKFGELRIYSWAADPEINRYLEGLTGQARLASQTMCETCGAEAEIRRLRPYGRIAALCERDFVTQALDEPERMRRGLRDLFDGRED
jgi:hypothetical protein